MIEPAAVMRFVKSITHGLREGWPVRTQKRIRELFAICKACPHYVAKGRVNGHCGLCGCICAGDTRQINKLRCAWEVCPDGRFEAEEGVAPVKGGCKGCGK